MTIKKSNTLFYTKLGTGFLKEKQINSKMLKDNFNALDVGRICRKHFISPIVQLIY